MKKNTELDENYVCKLYENGLSTHEISHMLTVSRSPIQRILKKNNILIRRVGHPQKYTCNENFFKNDNEEVFYVAGFIAADGTIRKQKYSKVLKIALSSKDKNHLIKIQKLLENNSPIKNYIAKSKNGKIAKNNAKHTTYKYSELTITSSNIFDDLSRFNILPNKTYNYTLPNWLINHELFRHFIRGYIDGDGSICVSYKNDYHKPQISFSLLGNYDVLNDINNILIKIGINKAKINHKLNTKNTYRIRYSGNIQMFKLGNFLYENATIYLDRKYNNIKMIL